MSIVFVKRTSNRKKIKSPFSKILNELMDEKKIGVREAARIADIGPSTLVSWRGGALPEDYVAVKRLATHLGVSLSYLLTGEDETRSEGSQPLISEVLEDAGLIFDGYAKITIQRLLPRGTKK